MLMDEEITNLTFLCNKAVVFFIRLLGFNNRFVTVQDLYNRYRKEKNDQQKRYCLAVL